MNEILQDFHIILFFPSQIEKKTQIKQNTDNRATIAPASVHHHRNPCSPRVATIATTIALSASRRDLHSGASTACRRSCSLCAML